jgi:uncharacterized protein
MCFERRKQMKTRISVLLAAAFIFLGGFFITQQGRAQTSQDDFLSLFQQRTISVSGVGQVRAEPDQASIRAGVQTRAQSAQEAIEENSQQMNALLDSLREAGVADEDIQTQTFRLRPLYEEQRQPEFEMRQIVGYHVENIVEVHIRDLEEIGTILDQMIEAGGNIIGNIRFEVGDRADLIDQARDAAMVDARHKADQLAEAAGAVVAEVLTIEETDLTPRSAPAVRADIPEAAVPIEPGAETIEVMVQVTWVIR